MVFSIYSRFSQVSRVALCTESSFESETLGEEVQEIFSCLLETNRTQNKRINLSKCFQLAIGNYSCYSFTNTDL